MNNQERRFNSYRLPRTELAQKLVDDVAEYVLSIELHDREFQFPNKRFRNRKKADYDVFRRQVTAIISDVAVREINVPGGFLFISRNKRELSRKSNYKPTFITEKIVYVMDMLARPELNLITIELGKREDISNPFSEDPLERVTKYVGLQTKIKAGPRLISMIKSYGLSSADFCSDDEEEVIYLKGKKEGNYWSTASLICYEDNPDVIKMRNDLKRINKWLEFADISYDGLLPIDLANRKMRRIFIESSW